MMEGRATASVEDLPKSPGVKIIRAGDESAWRDGYRLLAEAKEIYASERERGYADGLTAANQEAAKLVNQTAAKVDNYLASLDKDVAKLAFDIVQRIFNEFDDKELVARAAYNALADFREAKSVQIKVHPSAEDHVREVLSSYGYGHNRGTPSVIVETDDELGKASCILSTEFAIIEATIETQLAAIADAMGVPQRKPAP